MKKAITIQVKKTSNKVAILQLVATALFITTLIVIIVSSIMSSHYAAY